MQKLNGFIRGSDGVWRKRSQYGRHVEIVRRDAHGRLLGVERIHRPHGASDHVRIEVLEQNYKEVRV